MTDPVSRRTMMKTMGLGAAALAMGRGARMTLAEPQPAPAILYGEQSPLVANAAYELPPLPYPYNALEPAIDEQTLRVHHDKHHAGYVKGLNATLEKLKEARQSGDMSRIKALSRALAFHGSGHVLHTLYWRSMCPAASAQPTGALRAAIELNFGSFSAFRHQFLAATKDVEASGWGLLVHEPMAGRLLVLQAERHQDLTIWGVQPLLVCDVWEHASSYLQYRNRRADYVDRFFEIIDWSGAEQRYAQVAGAQ